MYKEISIFMVTEMYVLSLIFYYKKKYMLRENVKKEPIGYNSSLQLLF